MVQLILTNDPFYNSLMIFFWIFFTDNSQIPTFWKDGDQYVLYGPLEDTQDKIPRKS